MKAKKELKQIKAGLPEAVGVAARAAADALMHLDTGGKVFMALIWWAAGKKFTGKKRQGKVLARKRA